MTYENIWNELQEYLETKSDFGTEDTEPNYNIEIEISNYIKGGEFKQLSADDLEIFNDHGAEEVAQEISLILKRLHKELSNIPLSQLKTMQAFFRDKFWYVEI